MRDLFRLAGDLQVLLEEQAWKYCFIGGLALQRWGENRLTRDVDLTILTGFGRESGFIDKLLATFSGRRADAREFALQYRVLLLRSDENIGIDVSLAALPFEEALIERATDFEFLPASPVRTCSAEDLVVLKAFAARPQDWIDIRGVLVRQGHRLERDAIRTRLAPLVELKEEPEIERRLEALFDEVS